ncbi:transglycosylase family protein [Streptomyces sp. NPDC047108]|uniref:transglycosylase family protein n=1 Tax=Streptomyces sp. NPDC047108 TaxID=3155025 RepID=UPI0033FDB804
MSHVLIGRSMVLALAALMSMAPGASEAAPGGSAADKSPDEVETNGKNGTDGKFVRPAGATMSVMGLLATDGGTSVASGTSGMAVSATGDAVRRSDGSPRNDSSERNDSSDRKDTSPRNERSPRSERSDRSGRIGNDNDGNSGGSGGTAVWDRLAQCESSGDWHINSGNGYFGGLQIHHRTWVEHGGLAFAARADLATKQEQIIVARSVQARQGWNAWPVCAKRAGAASPVRPATQVDAARAVSGRVHVVRSGETLSSIARRYRVPGGWQALHRANARTVGADPDRLTPGTRLRVPVAKQAARPAARPAAAARPARKPAARPAATARPAAAAEPVPVVKRPAAPDRTPSPAVPVAAHGVGGA